MNIGVILAAGNGKRFSSYMNKQYLKINGKEMVYYSLAAMRNSRCLDKILLVVDSREYESKYIQNKYNVECVLGGETRNQSIRNAIDYILENYKDCEKIIFHDSARPILRSVIIQKYINALDKYDGVITYNEIVDALVAEDLSDRDRANYRIVQTPEAFRFSKILNFDGNSKIKAMASQFKNLNYLKVKADVFNMKVTYIENLFEIEQLLRLDYYSVSHKEKFDIKDLPKTILLFGGNGGIGQILKEYFQKNGCIVYAPSHKELDLEGLTVDKIKEYMNGVVPNAIINAAAVYYNDDDGIVEHFNQIFDVNVKANLVLIDYALKTTQKVNIVMFSSSSSTRGRQNLTNYSAAKAALNSIVESISFRTKKIRVNAVIPEKVNTPLLAKLHKTAINERELLEPKDVINVVKYLCCCDESGQLIHIRKGI